MISHAICAIGPQDLRHVSFIETGDKLENGTPIKIPVASAIRKIIIDQRWTATVRSGLFRKYGELLKKIERKAEDAIQFEPSDVEAEIERLEARLTLLKAERDNRKETIAPSKVSEMVQALAAEDVQEQEVMKDNIALMDITPQEATQEPQETPPSAPVVQPYAPPATQARQGRQSVIPTAATPPQATRTPPPQTAAPQAPQQPQAAQFDDSFIDSDDPEISAEHIAETNRRMFLARQKQGLPVTQMPPPPITGVPRRPPHADALEANEQVQDGGNNLHRSEVITKREAVSARPLGLNSTKPTQGTQNPRFRSPIGRG